jgi:DNA-directed RNA polymerase subunit RPC12/RpoP
MSDLISRKAVQKYIEKIRQVAQMMDDIIRRESIVMNGMDLCEEAVRNQPSAQSERKKGKWILHPEIKNVYGGTVVQCSECGEEYVVQYLEDEKYCRNCGAKMEEQNETD